MPITSECLAAVETNTHLAFLTLWKEEMDDNDLFQLTEVLNKNHTISHLDLSDNKITHHGVFLFISLLRNNYTLARLFFSRNYLGDFGAVMLAEELTRNESGLIELDLSANDISDAGAMTIANMLMHNSTLVSLNLTGNNIGLKGINAIFKALENNYTLTILDCGANNFEDKIIENINHYLKRNQQMAIELLNNINRKDFQSVNQSLALGVSPCANHARKGLKINGTSALHIAVRNIDSRLVSLLLEKNNRKALLYLNDEEGYTPANLAKVLNYESIEKTLNTHLLLNRKRSSFYQEVSARFSRPPTSFDKKIDEYRKKSEEEIYRINQQLSTLEEKHTKNQQEKDLIYMLKLEVEDIKERQSSLEQQLKIINDLLSSDIEFSEDKKLIEKHPKAHVFYNGILLYLNSVYTGDVVINSGNVDPSTRQVNNNLQKVIAVARTVTDILATPLGGIVLGGVFDIVSSSIDHVDGNVTAAKTFNRIKNHADPMVAYKLHAHIAVFMTLALIEEIHKKDNSKECSKFKKRMKKLSNIFVCFNPNDTELERYAAEQATIAEEAKQQISPLFDVKEFAFAICLTALGLEEEKLGKQLETGRQYLQNCHMPSSNKTSAAGPAPNKIGVYQPGITDAVAIVLSREIEHVWAEIKAIKERQLSDEASSPSVLSRNSPRP